MSLWALPMVPWILRCPTLVAAPIIPSCVQALGIVASSLIPKILFHGCWAFHLLNSQPHLLDSGEGRGASRICIRSISIFDHVLGNSCRQYVRTVVELTAVVIYAAWWPVSENPYIMLVCRFLVLQTTMQLWSLLLIFLSQSPLLPAPFW